MTDERRVIAQNRKARHLYHFLEHEVAGIELESRQCDDLRSRGIVQFRRNQYERTEAALAGLPWMRPVSSEVGWDVKGTAPVTSASSSTPLLLIPTPTWSSPQAEPLQRPTPSPRRRAPYRRSFANAARPASMPR